MVENKNAQVVVLKLPPHIAFHNGGFSLRGEALASYVWIDILHALA